MSDIRVRFTCPTCGNDDHTYIDPKNHTQVCYCECGQMLVLEVQPITVTAYKVVVPEPPATA